MNQAGNGDWTSRPTWGGSSDDRPSTPSWLAPPLESQTFPVARSAGPLADAPEPSDAALETPEVASAHLDLADLFQPSFPDLREEVARLRSQLEAQRGLYVELRRAVVAASEPDLVRLACAVAERVVRRELQLDPGVIVGWIRDAVGQLEDGDLPAVAIASDLAAVLQDAGLREAVAAIATVDVDPALPAMRCEVRTRASRVEASLEAQMAAVAEHLGVASP